MYGNPINMKDKAQTTKSQADKPRSKTLNGDRICFLLNTSALKAFPKIPNKLTLLIKIPFMEKTISSAVFR